MGIKDIARQIAEKETGMESCQNCGRLSGEIQDGLCESCHDYFSNTIDSDDFVYWGKGE